MTAAKNFKIELNPEFARALDLMENTPKNVFVTGRAGTGKSTLLQYFRLQTKKKIVVLAPTGVAAVNVKGQTIHSFFGFKPNIVSSKIKKIKGLSRDSIFKQLDAIVIDEISMVRADMLDYIDKFLRLNGQDKNMPFGGVQMIMIGDLYQLPPVLTRDEKEIFNNNYATPYFFSANVFSPQQKLLHDQNEFSMEMIELEKIYRQNDNIFIQLLNSIRNNNVGLKELELLNNRLRPLFNPAPEEKYIHLTTTNQMAAEHNIKELAKLNGHEYVFDGSISGRFDEKSLSTDVSLKVKIGSQVMLLNNDSDGRWVNGTVGTIVDVEVDEDKKHVIMVELADGDILPVRQHRWDIYRFSYDTKESQIAAESVGSFTQFPLKLAWAVTIHKSQGKTFDRVVVDIGNGTFSPGQLYVALSRCTSLEGIILRRQVERRHIWLDERVVQFMTKFQYKKSEEKMSQSEKVSFIESAIDSEQKISIIYLKAQDIKSRRVIIPHEVGEMEYMGKQYVGVSAYCLQQKKERIFRVDRILEMTLVE